MAQSLRIESADCILADPRWFPVDIDKETGGLLLSDVGDTHPGWSPQAGSDGTEASKSAAKVLLTPAQTFQLTSSQRSRPRLNFIWHTAWCCSTAIAHALDVPGLSLSLQEPHVLNSAARARRECDLARRGDISWVSDAIFRLIARSPVGDVAVTVKPAPVANYLVADALAKTHGKMLFLHSNCHEFLLASMRHDEFRRRFVRGLFGFVANQDGKSRWSPEAIAGMTDLEVAGLLWMLQMEKFARDIKRCGERAASLDCALFLERPKDVVGALWRFFELPGRALESGTFRDEDFFNRHLTYPDENFSPAARHEAMAALPRRLQGQIDEIARSSIALLPKGALPLPNPLMMVENSTA